MADAPGAGAAPPPAAAPSAAAPPPDGARRRSLARRAALALAVGALLLLAGATAATLLGESRHSVHDSGPRGLQAWGDQLRGDGHRVESLGAGPHALDAAENPAGTVFVVAGVERAYSPGEVQAIVGFVERGGTALIADDFGYADAVGQRFGVNFDHRVLRDAAFAGNQSLVRVNATLGGANFSLIANVPSSLGFAPRLQPRLIAESSSDSYIDQNLDGIEGPEDTKGPFRIIAEVGHGQGRAVFVSDPGLFANNLAQDNAPFLRALAADLQPEPGAFLFDESRHPMGPVGAVLGALLAGEVQATSEAPLAAAAGASMLLLAGLLFGAFRPPEDITAHRSRLQDPVHAVDAALQRTRFQRLATRAVADANDISADDLAAATPQSLAAKARDPLLAALIKGEAVKATPQECLDHIRAHGKSRRA